MSDVSLHEEAEHLRQWMVFLGEQAGDMPRLVRAAGVMGDLARENARLRAEVAALYANLGQRPPARSMAILPEPLSGQVWRDPAKPADNVHIKAVEGEMLLLMRDGVPEAWCDKAGLFEWALRTNARPVSP